MNLQQGRIGWQEATALAGISVAVCGLFTTNTKDSFANGNLCYLTSAVGVLLSVLVFLCTLAAMRRMHAEDLFELLCRACGAWAGKMLAVYLCICLLAYAIAPLLRFLLIMNRYVFSQSEAADIGLYFVPCVVILAWLGLEALGRSAKLFAIPVALSLLLPFLIAAPEYRLDRLFPIGYAGMETFIRQSLRSVSRFLPALLALLTVTRGLHGTNAVSRVGMIGGLGGGAAVSCAYFGLGMTYTYQMLAGMHSPMFRMTMATRSGSVYVRTDKVLLFFWTLGGLIASAFSVYAASVLYTRALSMRDIRPAAGVFGTVAVAAAIMGHVGLSRMDAFGEWISVNAWALILAPVITADIAALIRREKRG